MVSVSNWVVGLLIGEMDTFRAADMLVWFLTLYLSTCAAHQPKG